MKYTVTSTAIIHELLDEEVIIANLEKGTYYSLRGCSIPIWQLVVTGHSLQAIASLFAKKFGLDRSEEIRAFMQSLVKEDLIREDSVENLPPTLPSTLVWPAEFKTPTFEKYEEMKDLLMLDPVHEVDAQGWPSRS